MSKDEYTTTKFENKCSQNLISKNKSLYRSFSKIFKDSRTI